MLPLITKHGGRPSAEELCHSKWCAASNWNQLLICAVLESILEKRYYLILDRVFPFVETFID